MVELRERLNRGILGDKDKIFEGQGSRKASCRGNLVMRGWQNQTMEV